MRLSALALLVTALHAPLMAQDFQYTILYTGRTLGYARLPDSQSLTPTTPTTPAPNAVAAAYKSLFDAAQLKATGTVLRVGMGDNFSPSLNARTFEVTDAPRRMKDRYFFDGKIWQDNSAASGSAQSGGTSSIPFDNVAQFFIYAGYRALVPGKHDFYYGVERLRDLARLMAEGDVHMLAANLAMTSSVNGPNPRIPERYAHHPYKTDFKGVTIQIPDTVFPYKRQFLVKNAQQVRQNGKLVRQDKLKSTAGTMTVVPLIAEARVCWAEGENDEDPDKVATPGTTGAHCTQLQPQPQDPKAISPDVQYALVDATLKAGHNHLFCISFPTDPDWTCKPFPVAEPFFEHDMSPTPKHAPKRYVVVPGGQPVAIFGVVDPDMLTNIGLLNTGWQNDVRRWNTVVKVVAPDSALEQLLEECEADRACKGTRKVLLAQMSYARAAQLGTHLKEKFDVVISEADPDHYTASRDLRESVAPDKSYPNLLLTPPVPYEGNPTLAEDRFVSQVSAATIVNSGGHWKLHNRVKAAPPTPLGTPCGKPSCVTLSAMANAVFKERKMASSYSTPTLAAPPSLVVTDLALYAMRRHAKADIAILQKRDLFNADRLSDEPFQQRDLQDRINNIFWKGDFVWSVEVTGAQLKSLLKQSAKFDAADDDLLATEVERNRGLVTLGLYANTGDPLTFYVNGARLDDAGLYTVATTDYLSLGDTGYADLATPAVPPARRIKDFRNLPALAGVICAEIASIPAYKGIPCDTERLDTSYFDHTSQTPTDTTSGMNTARQYATFFKDFVNPSVPSMKPEGNAQQRHFLALNLESGDFSFNAVMLRNARTMPGTFTGVSAPGVTSKGTSTTGRITSCAGSTTSASAPYTC